MAPPASLPTRKLGKTNVDIPVIGFGMMGLSIAYGFVGYVHSLNGDRRGFAMLDE